MESRWNPFRQRRKERAGWNRGDSIQTEMGSELKMNYQPKCSILSNQCNKEGPGQFLCIIFVSKYHQLLLSRKLPPMVLSLFSPHPIYGRNLDFSSLSFFVLLCRWKWKRGLVCASERESERQTFARFNFLGSQWKASFSTYALGPRRVLWWPC